MAGAAKIQVSKVRLFFKTKPCFTSNKSGIDAPGVTVFFAPVVNSIPQVANIASLPFSRVEYSDIKTSANAAIGTDFNFANNIQTTTGNQWSVVIKYDGNEDFELWKEKIGDPIIGSNTVSAGPSGKFSGKYYTYISPVPSASNGQINANTGIVSLSSTGSNTLVANSDYTDTAWRALNDTDLKLQVYCARFSVAGNNDLTTYFGTANTTVPIPAGITNPTCNTTQNSATSVVSFQIPVIPYEFIVYDRRYSIPAGVLVGERIWQWRPYIGKPIPFTITCTATSTRVTCSGGFKWSDYFFMGVDDEYIIIVSENHDGAGRHRHIPRRVRAILSDYVIDLDEACSFSNTACYFYKSAIAHCERDTPTYAFGVDEDMVILRHSTANSTMRFQNNCIEAITIASTNGISANGGGYSNSDYIVVSGYEYVANAVVGGANAYANIVTNNLGNVTAIYLTNTGCGFVNTAAITVRVANSSGGNSNGTGLIVQETIDATMVSEFQWDGTKGFFKKCRIANLDLDDCFPSEFVRNPLGTFYTIAHRLRHYRRDNPACIGGYSYHEDDVDDDNDFYIFKPGNFCRHKYRKRRCHLSWSYECIIDKDIVVTSNTSSLVVNCVSNNDFVCCCVDDGSIAFTKYVINNDYTLENTNSGNAWAKSITSVVNFANNTFAEDLQAYMTVYRPANTDLKLFARIHNSHDPEPLVNKDWTLLQVDSGNSLFSSQTNANDYVEIAYGFSPNPNTAFRLAGSGTTILNQTNVTGSGTTWSSNATANLHSGDMVMLSQPLFPNNYMVCLVSNVVSDTVITLDTPVSNNGLIGTNLNVDKIAFPHQAFNNSLNSNIVRYYSNSYAQFDTFDSMQFKVVMLSSNSSIIPRVKNIRCMGISV